MELTSAESVAVDCKVTAAVGNITCLGILPQPHNPKSPPAYNPPQVVPPNPFQLEGSHIN